MIGRTNPLLNELFLSENTHGLIFHEEDQVRKWIRGHAEFDAEAKDTVDVKAHDATVRIVEVFANSRVDFFSPHAFFQPGK